MTIYIYIYIYICGLVEEVVRPLEAPGVQQLPEAVLAIDK